MASAPGAELADDRRDQVVHGRVLLQREQLRHPHAAGPADARQVVAQQVHDHHVLGAVLLALGQRLAQRRVVHRPEAARPRALDRAGSRPARPVERQEALGRRAEDGHVVAGRDTRRTARGSRARRRAIERRAAPRSAGPRIAARGSPGRCRPRGCTPARAAPRSGSPGAVKDERSPIASAALERRARDRMGRLARRNSRRRREAAETSPAAAADARRRGPPPHALAARVPRAAPSRRQAGGDEPRPAVGMIPRDHPVVQAEHRVGQREVVVPRRRAPLEDASPVVAEVAGGAAVERAAAPAGAASASGASCCSSTLQHVARAPGRHSRCPPSRVSVRGAMRAQHRPAGRRTRKRPAAQVGVAVGGAVEPDAATAVRAARAAASAASGAAIEPLDAAASCRRPPGAAGALRERHVLGPRIIGRREVAPLQRALLPVGLAERDGELAPSSAPCPR